MSAKPCHSSLELDSNRPQVADVFFPPLSYHLGKRVIMKSYSEEDEALGWPLGGIWF